MMPPPTVDQPLQHCHPRGSRQVEGVVVHGMGEYIRLTQDLGGRMPAWDFLQRSDSVAGAKLSAHALVSPGGTVVRCVPDGQVAYHAGVSEWGERKNLNPWYLGVELLVAGDWAYGPFRHALQDGSATYPLAQQEAAAWLIASWTDTHNLPFANLVRHSDVSPGRKYDPGMGLHWSGFQTLVGDWLDQFDREERGDDA